MRYMMLTGEVRDVELSIENKNNTYTRESSPKVREVIGRW